MKWHKKGAVEQVSKVKPEGIYWGPRIGCHLVNMVRSVIQWVGILPGIGANVGSVMTYTAESMSKNRKHLVQAAKKEWSPVRQPIMQRLAEH